MTSWLIDNDGIDHINVYSHGRTELGRLLSNFANTPFKHPIHGYFTSVEGFWYYIKTGFQHEQLRRLYGSSAKSSGMKFVPVQMDEDKFHELVCEAIESKIIQTPDLHALFITSTLPFTHYFVYGAKLIPQKKHEWQMQFLTELRERLKRSE